MPADKSSLFREPQTVVEISPAGFITMPRTLLCGSWMLNKDFFFLFTVELSVQPTLGTYITHNTL